MTTKHYPGGMQDWNCNSTCQLISIPKLCSVLQFNCSTDYLQGININSYSLVQLSQSIKISRSAEYLLEIDWLPPYVYPIGKAFLVKFDALDFVNMTCDTDLYINHTQQYLVNLTAGYVDFSI
jgi:hypothetical protein